MVPDTVSACETGMSEVAATAIRHVSAINAYLSGFLLMLLPPRRPRSAVQGRGFAADWDTMSRAVPPQHLQTLELAQRPGALLVGDGEDQRVGQYYRNVERMKCRSLAAGDEQRDRGHIYKCGLHRICDQDPRRANPLRVIERVVRFWSGPREGQGERGILSRHSWSITMMKVFGTRLSDSSSRRWRVSTFHQCIAFSFVARPGKRRRPTVTTGILAEEHSPGGRPVLRGYPRGIGSTCTLPATGAGAVD